MKKYKIIILLTIKNHNLLTKNKINLKSINPFKNKIIKKLLIKIN